MKDMKRSHWVGALALAPALLIWACGSSGNGVSGPTLSSSAPVDVAGSWVGTWSLDRGGEGREFGPDLSQVGGSIRLFLQQSGSAVTGAVEFTGLFGKCLENASVSGTFAAGLISLTLTNGTAGFEGRLQGQVEGNTLNGSYVNSCIESATLVLQRE